MQLPVNKVFNILFISYLVKIIEMAATIVLESGNSLKIYGVMVD